MTSTAEMLPFTEALEQNEVFTRLRAGIEQITALKQALSAVLPDYLAPMVFVGPIKKGVLKLLTTSSASASRLRHLGPSLIQALQQQGWSVHALRIHVQQHAIRYDTPPPKKEAKISAVGLMHLQQLSEQLAPSSLKDALTKMVTHHTRYSLKKH